jgi:hypothetical protein
VARTPEEWLPVLAKRIDDAAPRTRLLRSYMDGNAPLPEAGPNTRESWKRFQRESRTNWGLLILEAVTDRIVKKGILVNGDSQSDVARQAQRIWRDNRMDHVFQEWLRDGLALRQSFFTCWQGEDGRAVITSDSPDTMCVAADPLQPWRVRAALRCWRDLDMEKDFALVMAEDSLQYFSRPARVEDKFLTGMVQGDWRPNDGPVAAASKPPVAVYNNPGGMGEYEPHLDVINRINNGILERRVIQAMEAFRQRALKSKAERGGLPKKDGDGNDIPWGDIFAPAPGALWDLPPDVDIWESSPTDIRPLLEGSKDDIRQLSAVSRTPLPILMPDNTNTSAAGAISAETGYISKCGTRLAEAKVGVEAILVKALEVEGVEGLEDLTVSVEFEPVERVSTAEKYQAAGQAKAILSSKSIQRDILGWGPDEIRQDAIDRADEALRAMALMPPVQRQTPVNDRTGTDRPS